MKQEQNITIPSITLQDVSVEEFLARDNDSSVFMYFTSERLIASCHFALYQTFIFRENGVNLSMQHRWSSGSRL